MFRSELSICSCPCPLAFFFLLYWLPLYSFSVFCFLCCPRLLCHSCSDKKLLFLHCFIFTCRFALLMGSSPATGWVPLVFQVCLSIFVSLCCWGVYCARESTIWCSAFHCTVEPSRASVDLSKSSLSVYCGCCLAQVMETLGRSRRFKDLYAMCSHEYPVRAFCGRGMLLESTCDVAGYLMARETFPDCSRYGLCFPHWRLDSIVAFHSIAVLGARIPLPDATSFAPNFMGWMAQLANTFHYIGWSCRFVSGTAILARLVWVA